MLTRLSPINISPIEQEFLNKIEQLSARSGSHSPSLGTMQQAIPEIEVDIDACYLSNPLATDLFWSYFNADVLADPQLFKRMLEAYPSQNNAIAERLSVASVSMQIACSSQMARPKPFRQLFTISLCTFTSTRQPFRLITNLQGQILRSQSSDSTRQTISQSTLSSMWNQFYRAAPIPLF